MTKERTARYQVLVCWGPGRTRAPDSVGRCSVRLCIKTVTRICSQGHIKERLINWNGTFSAVSAKKPEKVSGYCWEFFLLWPSYWKQPHVKQVTGGKGNTLDQVCRCWWPHSVYFDSTWPKSCGNQWYALDSPFQETRDKPIRIMGGQIQLWYLFGMEWNRTGQNRTEYNTIEQNRNCFIWKGPQQPSSPTAWPLQGWPKVKAHY